MLKVSVKNPFPTDKTWEKLKNFSIALMERYGGKFKLISSNWDSLHRTASIEGSVKIMFLPVSAKFNLAVTDSEVVITSDSPLASEGIYKPLIETNIKQALNECLK